MKRTWSEESLTVSVGVPHVDSSLTLVWNSPRIFYTARANSETKYYPHWKYRHFLTDEILTLPISEPIELTVSSWTEHGTKKLKFGIIFLDNFNNNKKWPMHWPMSIFAKISKLILHFYFLPNFTPLTQFLKCYPVSKFVIICYNKDLFPKGRPNIKMKTKIRHF